MKKTLYSFIATILLLLFMVSLGYCGANNWGNTDIHPLLGREFPNDLVYRGAKRGGVSTITSWVSNLNSTHLAFSILKLAGASKTFTIAAGEVGQEITLVKSDTDARVLKLSMTILGQNTTHTGFSSVTWDTLAGGFVTLAWIDSTVGWIITGSNDGVTIAY